MFLFKIVSKYLNKKEVENHYIYIKLFSMLNAGVIGAGHLGKIHLKLLNQSTKYNLIGFHDSDSNEARRISEESGCFGGEFRVEGADSTIGFTSETEGILLGVGDS